MRLKFGNGGGEQKRTVWIYIKHTFMDNLNNIIFLKLIMIDLIDRNASTFWIHTNQNNLKKSVEKVPSIYITLKTQWSQSLIGNTQHRYYYYMSVDIYKFARRACTHTAWLTEMHRKIWHHQDIEIIITIIGVSSPLFRLATSYGDTCYYTTSRTFADRS